MASPAIEVNQICEVSSGRCGERWSLRWTEIFEDLFEGYQLHSVLVAFLKLLGVSDRGVNEDVLPFGTGP